jgi:hypothetical protein
VKLYWLLEEAHEINVIKVKTHALDLRNKKWEVGGYYITMNIVIYSSHPVLLR